MKILLAGCGDIACRLAALLHSPSNEIIGLRRHVAQLPAGIEPLAADLSRPIAPLPAVDYVVVTLSPGEFSEPAYRRTYIDASRHLLGALTQAPKRLFWISSTSVYGQHHGEWVDESSPTEPRSFSGKVLLEAESLITSHPVATTVVRFSGIYGPGRLQLLQQVRAGVGCAETPQLWSNRIHVDDCAGVLAHLINRTEHKQSVAPLYLASDSEPATQYTVRHWLAQQLGVGLREEQLQVRGNRRASNRRLLQSGYRFLYPSFRQGYRQLIEGLTP